MCELKYSEWEKTRRDRTISFSLSFTLDQKISRERAMYDMYRWSLTPLVSEIATHKWAMMTLIVMTITTTFFKSKFLDSNFALQYLRS